MIKNFDELAVDLDGKPLEDPEKNTVTLNKIIANQLGAHHKQDMTFEEKEQLYLTAKKLSRVRTGYPTLCAARQGRGQKEVWLTARRGHPGIWRGLSRQSAKRNPPTASGITAYPRKHAVHGTCVRKRLVTQTDERHARIEVGRLY